MRSPGWQAAEAHVRSPRAALRRIDAAYQKGGIEPALRGVEHAPRVTFDERPDGMALAHFGPMTTSTLSSWRTAPSVLDLARGRGQLTRGMAGDSVRDVQRALGARGYLLDADGKLGAATAEALRRETGSATVDRDTLDKLGLTGRSGATRARGGAARAPTEKELRSGPPGTVRAGFFARSRAPSVENPVKPMSQLAYGDRLGNGRFTIKSSGCLLTAMAMASTRITGRDTDPRQANTTVRNAGGFSGSALEVPDAARALGMRLSGRQAMAGANASRMVSELDRSLDRGRPAIAGVDFHEGRSSAVSNADHFITITGRTRSGDYTAIDPLGGHRITLKKGSDGMLTSGAYKVSELLFLDRR